MQLDEFLEERYFGNPTSAWLIAFAIFLGTFVVLVVARLLVLRRFGAFAKRTATDLDDLIVDLARLTRYFFLLTVSVLAAALVLQLPPRLSAIVHAASIIAVLLQIGLWGNGIIGFLTHRYIKQRAADGAARTTLLALGVGARLLFWSVMLLVALKNFNIDITALVAGLGIGGIAIALAVQNILGDLFGAVSIVLDRPFVVDDYIVVDQFQGTVEHIGLKTTRLRSLSGEQIIISNADLLKSRIRNYKRMFERRVAFVIRVVPDTPPEALARIPGILRSIIESQELVRFERSHFATLSESSLDFESVYWVTVSDYNRYMDIQQAINLEILRRLDAENVRIAFPTRVVMLESDDGSRLSKREERSREASTPGAK